MVFVELDCFAEKRAPVLQCDMRRATDAKYPLADKHNVKGGTDFVSQHKEDAEIFEHGTLRHHLQIQDTAHS